MAEESTKTSINERRAGSRVTWRPPLTGWVKCNIDAVFVKAHSTGAIAAVFGDHTGNLLSGLNSTTAASLQLAAKVLVVRASLIMAKNFELQKIIIGSDSLILIQALKSQASIAEIQVILKDILDIARSIPNCGFT
ncbi:hypothetical protein Ahy_A06g029476 [Arachis hypogaea]|uniref:RNase H type-1 domain-containing protein n=1 Tax=Arachis hypogaea TaxID=3818 RepID=A0A445CTH9_ARAHY|nr:hypothetical protein Ahy_A06g029476 [Arachis hypogaea]